MAHIRQDENMVTLLALVCYQHEEYQMHLACGVLRLKVNLRLNFKIQGFPIIKGCLEGSPVLPMEQGRKLALVIQWC